jgi:Na+-translocating ferredoxin:NAD+ oxidoreductase subunit B
MAQGLAAQILAALPQTQCTRCGYPDCAAYAQAVADGSAAINQCPPGGDEGVQRLSAITGQPALPLNPANGLEGPRAVAVIDENWCIGCTLCLPACPTDAILGSNKMMHTVIEPHCTGCELCLPVCPVDCISMENVTGTASGWAAWSPQQADTARNRYELKSYRRISDEGQGHKRQVKPATEALGKLPAPSRMEDPALLEKKRAVVEAALARARRKADLDKADLARPGPPRPSSWPIT